MKKVLIANRGEIALRIMRSCKKLGLKTVAVYSDADCHSPHVSAADESYALRGSTASESYLSVEKILRAVDATASQAVHPGYGFLAESPEFAAALKKAGLTFVGPSAETLRLAGNKDSARKVATKCGVPIPLGYDGEEQFGAVLLAAASKLGTPLLIKAVAGGGGRGMRLVRDPKQLEEALASAASEAESFFADRRLILEQYISPARHIEVQLIADSFGNVCHLYERDCSLQRRYQKVIEESPARALPERIRVAICEAAVRLGKEVKLSGAATVEFLVPEDQKREPYYFLEINPRIQVEHPVTEIVTGLDLVEWQLRIARGEAFLEQHQIQTSGHAIEARVCAEVPAEGFRPSAGRVSLLTLPNGNFAENVRLDHALRAGLEVTTNYDSLVLKVISAGHSAAEATSRLESALGEIAIGGIETNLWFLRNVLRSGWYGKDKVPHTSLLDSELESFVRPKKSEERELLAMMALAGHLVALFLDSKGLRSFRGRANEKALTLPALQFSVSALSFGAAEPHTFSLEELKLRDNELECRIDGAVFGCENTDQGCYIKNKQRTLRCVSAGFSGPDLWTAKTLQSVDHLNFSVARVLTWLKENRSASNVAIIRAPLPGTVIAVDVVPGQLVQEGDRLLVIESMKMEHALRVPRDAQVAEVRTTPQAKVKEQEILVVLSDGMPEAI